MESYFCKIKPYLKTHQEVDELSSHFVKMVHTGDGIRTEMISTMAEFSKVELFVVDKQGKLIGKSGSALMFTIK